MYNTTIKCDFFNLNAIIENDLSKLDIYNWLVNTTISTHIINDRFVFIDFESIQSFIDTIDNNNDFQILNTNTIYFIILTQNDSSIDFQLSNAIYVLFNNCNLLFLFILLHKIKLKNLLNYTKIILLIANNEKMSHVLLKKKLYEIQININKNDSRKIMTTTTIDYDNIVWKWYRRFNYLSWKNIKQFLKQNINMNLINKQIQIKTKVICFIYATIKTIVKISRNSIKKKYDNVEQLLIVNI